MDHTHTAHAIIHTEGNGYIAFGWPRYFRMPKLVSGLIVCSTYSYSYLILCRTNCLQIGDSLTVTIRGAATFSGPPGQHIHSGPCVLGEGVPFNYIHLLHS